MVPINPDLTPPHHRIVTSRLRTGRRLLGVPEGVRTGLVVRPATLADLPALHALADRAVEKLLVDEYSTEQLDAVRRAGGHEVEPSLVAAGNYYAAGLTVTGALMRKVVAVS